MIYWKNLWIAMKANAGGRPCFVHKNPVFQMVLFVCLLAGVIIWIVYRASFTSELSVIKLNLPFNDLESLSKSDFKWVLNKLCKHVFAKFIFMILSRLIGPPSSWAISQQFHSSQEDSIYVKLYKNNMDGLNSFFPVENGLQHILSNDSLALIYDLSVSHMKFKCKVK